MPCDLRPCERPLAVAMSDTDILSASRHDPTPMCWAGRDGRHCFIDGRAAISSILATLCYGRGGAKLRLVRDRRRRPAFVVVRASRRRLYEPCSARRLSGKDFGGDISAGSVLSVGSERLALGPAARLSRGYPVVVELQEVVGGGYQPPFGLHRGPASSLEAVDLAVELDVAVGETNGAGRAENLRPDGVTPPAMYAS